MTIARNNRIARLGRNDKSTAQIVFHVRPLKKTQNSWDLISAD